MPCHARATALSFYPPAMPVQCHARGAKRAGPPPSSVPCSAATRTVGRSAGCCGDEHTSNSRSISKLDSWALLCHRGREDFENSLTHPHDVHYYSGGRAPSNAPRTAHSVAAVKEGGKEGEGEAGSQTTHTRRREESTAACPSALRLTSVVDPLHLNSSQNCYFHFFLSAHSGSASLQFCSFLVQQLRTGFGVWVVWLPGPAALLGPATSRKKSKHW